MLLGLKGNFESWIALLITTSQAANEDEVGSMGWIWFLSAYDGALGGGMGGGEEKVVFGLFLVR